MILKEHEKKAIGTLIGDALPESLLNELLSSSLVEIEDTRVGYFLIISHQRLPKIRSVYSQPLITTSFDQIDAGYLVFIEDHRLTLECHSLEDRRMNNQYRNQELVLKIVPEIHVGKVGRIISIVLSVVGWTFLAASIFLTFTFLPMAL